MPAKRCAELVHVMVLNDRDLTGSDFLIRIAISYHVSLLLCVLDSLLNLRLEKKKDQIHDCPAKVN